MNATFSCIMVMNETLEMVISKMIVVEVMIIQD